MGWLLFALQLAGLVATLALAVYWKQVWGDFDLWIPPTIAVAHTLLAIAAVVAFGILGSVRPLPPLLALFAGAALNTAFMVVAWNDLPSTAFE